MTATRADPAGLNPTVACSHRVSARSADSSSWAFAAIWLMRGGLSSTGVTGTALARQERSSLSFALMRSTPRMASAADPPGLKSNESSGP
jgi:hypothetical protein